MHKHPTKASTTTKARAQSTTSKARAQKYNAKNDQNQSHN